MATREYRCMKCGRVDTYGPVARPVHCGVPMKPGELGGVRDDSAVKIDLVKPQVAPDVTWALPGDPISIFEVWVFRPMKRQGEKLGWIAERETCWEYRLVTGLPLSSGFASSRNADVEKIYEAFEK